MVISSCDFVCILDHFGNNCFVCPQEGIGIPYEIPMGLSY